MLVDLIDERVYWCIKEVQIFVSYKLFTSSDVGETVQESNSSSFGRWRLRVTVALRITFGLVWAIDAWFKAQPAFVQNFIGYLVQARASRSAALVSWLTFWLHIVKLNPPLFAYTVVAGESCIALCLLLGACFNLTCFAGVAVSILICWTAQGFGSPYGPGSADIGVLMIYVLIFVGLFLGNAGSICGVDEWLGKLLGRWSFLASGSAQSRRPSKRQGIAPISHVETNERYVALLKRAP